MHREETRSTLLQAHFSTELENLCGSACTFVMNEVLRLGCSMGYCTSVARKPESSTSIAIDQRHIFDKVNLVTPIVTMYSEITLPIA